MPRINAIQLKKYILGLIPQATMLNLFAGLTSASLAAQVTVYTNITRVV